MGGQFVRAVFVRVEPMHWVCFLLTESVLTSKSCIILFCVVAGSLLLHVCVLEQSAAAIDLNISGPPTCMDPTTPCS